MSWSAFLLGSAILLAVLFAVGGLRSTQKKVHRELKAQGKAVTNHLDDDDNDDDDSRKDERIQSAQLSADEVRQKLVDEPEPMQQVFAATPAATTTIKAASTTTHANSGSSSSSATQSPATTTRTRSRKV